MSHASCLILLLRCDRISWKFHLPDWDVARAWRWTLSVVLGSKKRFVFFYLSTYLPTYLPSYLSDRIKIKLAADARMNPNLSALYYRCFHASRSTGCSYFLNMLCPEFMEVLLARLGYCEGLAVGIWRGFMPACLAGFKIKLAAYFRMNANLSGEVGLDLSGWSRVW